MRKEEKKEYLNSYKKACIKLVALQEQMESLREVGQTARTQQLSDMPKGGKRHKDLSDLIVKLQDKIDDVVIKTLQVKVNIEESLLEIEDAEEARVLRFRYIDFMKWEEISEKMNYSYRQVLYVHGRALENYKYKKPA